MMTLQVQANKLFEATYTLSRRLGEALPDMLQNEGRLFLLEAIRKMPPKTHEQGKQAIARDISKLFTAVSDEFVSIVGSEHGISNIDAWTTFRSGERKRIKWDQIDYTGKGMYAFHQRNRNSRGRVNRGFKGSKNQDIWRAPYVVTRPVYEAYKLRRQDDSGLMKSGFLPALRVVAPDAKVSNWIAKHEPRAPGLVQYDLNHNSQSPFILVLNRARGVKEFERLLINVFATRIRALQRRLRRLAAGIADDVTRGRRIRKIETVTT